VLVDSPLDGRRERVRLREALVEARPNVTLRAVDALDAPGEHDAARAEPAGVAVVATVVAADRRVAREARSG
jgi:hypothetical protein